MTRVLPLAVLAAAVIVIALFAVLTRSVSFDTSERPWPAHVPANAAWVGGADGGVYVRIERFPDDPPDLYRGCVYHETAPWLAYRGFFSLERNGPYSPDQDPLTAWDGTRLYFGERGILKATTDYKPTRDEEAHPACDPASIPAGS
ncbi:hypothetical protein [Rhodospira trueperi]|uniref:Uncharacterized protein n=1 Tax=Rhodospira trueperi TaxID=69960 RepID=A0A1G6X0E6_9PROT|nr:hypothetical protein [Rhodospira trueperi]SDD71598.1 hypothetical protein SAMN05421720_101332 [Rhodospira trueperi]